MTTRYLTISLNAASGLKPAEMAYREGQEAEKATGRLDKDNGLALHAFTIVAAAYKRKIPLRDNTTFMALNGKGKQQSLSEWLRKACTNFENRERSFQSRLFGSQKAMSNAIGWVHCSLKGEWEIVFKNEDGSEVSDRELQQRLEAYELSSPVEQAKAELANALKVVQQSMGMICDTIADGQSCELSFDPSPSDPPQYAYTNDPPFGVLSAAIVRQARRRLSDSNARDLPFFCSVLHAATLNSRLEKVADILARLKLDLPFSAVFIAYPDPKIARAIKRPGLENFELGDESRLLTNLASLHRLLNRRKAIPVYLSVHGAAHWHTAWSFNDVVLIDRYESSHRDSHPNATEVYAGSTLPAKVRVQIDTLFHSEDQEWELFTPGKLQWSTKSVKLTGDNTSPMRRED